MVGLDLAGEGNWLFRGAVGWKHVWGELAGELIVPFARLDGHGEALSGARRYTRRFEAGEQPIRRYGIGTMGEEIQIDGDGSVTVPIQHDRPAGDAANWLPAPEGGFFLAPRMYQPDERMARGEYVVPPLQRAGGRARPPRRGSCVGRRPALAGPGDQSV